MSLAATSRKDVAYRLRARHLHKCRPNDQRGISVDWKTRRCASGLREKLLEKDRGSALRSWGRDVGGARLQGTAWRTTCDIRVNLFTSLTAFAHTLVHLTTIGPHTTYSSLPLCLHPHGRATHHQHPSEFHRPITPAHTITH